LLARQSPLASAQVQRQHLSATNACPPFDAKMQEAGLTPLHATGLTVFQINVGKLCNQT